jgi:hypothetical protein
MRFYPHGTAMNSTLQQVSGAIGSALLVTIMSNRTKTHAVDLLAAAKKHVAANPTPAAMAEMKQIPLKAMLEGINDSFLVSCAIACVALVLAFFIKRSKQAEDVQDVKSQNKKVTKKLVEN